MKRQKIRKLLLTVSLLFFPVTLYYFSPALIIDAGLSGIINGSFIVFVSMFLLAIPFGRLFCAYVCPAGGLQECAFTINSNKPKQGWKNNIKYVIWAFWVLMVVLCYFNSGKIVKIDFWFNTENGISVSSIQSYIIYYGIVFLIFIPSILFGKRIFCHYFCWMAPFMVLGTKIRRFLHLPGLHIQINNGSTCVSCEKCSNNCPMGLNVSGMINNNQIEDLECIQCGACVDSCPRKIFSYKVVPEKGKK